MISPLGCGEARVPGRGRAKLAPLEYANWHGPLSVSQRLGRAIRGAVEHDHNVETVDASRLAERVGAQLGQESCERLAPLMGRHRDGHRPVSHPFLHSPTKVGG